MLLSAPDDYGMTPEQTLAHEACGALPEGFEAYWDRQVEEVDALSTRWHARGADPVRDVVIPSLRTVRVIARLTLPARSPRGVVVVTHGSSPGPSFPEDAEPWSDFDLATLRLHIRGYPPSTLDIDDLGASWILHHIGSDSWVLRGAVVDVVQAYRCARRFFGPAVPISIYGESLGAGLTTIAAGHLTRMRDPPSRLVLALPSLGDWRWRCDHRCLGFGGLVNEALRAAREDASRLLQHLLLFDAAHHARFVKSPTLFKLALRDDVVPAPAAAAVFNAVSTSRKWRWLTDYGHYEGGIADLRRHALFERLHPRFLSPTREPEDWWRNASNWSDRHK